MPLRFGQAAHGPTLALSEGEVDRVGDTLPEREPSGAEGVAATVRDWGYQIQKLDFLYAASLPGVRHDPTVTRAQKQ